MPRATRVNERPLALSSALAIATAITIAAPARADDPAARVADDPPAAATSAAAVTSAPERLPLAWNPRYPKVRPLEYAVTVAAGAGLLLATRIDVADRHWSGDGFDDAIRRGVRLHDAGARQTVRSVGDGIFYGMLAYPFVVDALLVAGPRNGDVAWQLLVISGESTALSGLTSVLVERNAGRARPFLRECAADPSSSPGECGAGSEQDHMSFLSGHTLMAFNAAGLLCANHLHLGLYGNRFADVATCVLGTGLASFEGATRLMADRHYLTDVVTGSVVGFGAGFGLPMLLHYGGRDGAKSLPALVLPYAKPAEAGLQALGVF